jgi:cytoplasmic iron level regulating protein YaaA (DUF328/UPF0246 family)
VAAALVKAMSSGSAARQKLLGVKGDALAAATGVNASVRCGPTRPAIERYTGVLYDALDYADCPAALRRRLDRQVRILSGLWGVVAPRDPIPDYKLKMGASLPGVGKLSSMWREPLTEALAPMVRGRVVWDLLPNEHAAAWRPDELSMARRVTARFLDDVEKDGRRQLVTVSHWNKLLKGALVRHVIEHQVRDPAELVDFEHPEGYTYRPDLSSDTDAVFVR